MAGLGLHLIKVQKLRENRFRFENGGLGGRWQRAVRRWQWKDWSWGLSGCMDRSNRDGKGVQTRKRGKRRGEPNQL
jgi:hypothetical protein